MKNKYEHLPIDEQIIQYRRANKTLLICAIICTIVVIGIVIALFAFELDKALAIGFLCCLPFSWWIGYYIPKKENDKKIRELENNFK